MGIIVRRYYLDEYDWDFIPESEYGLELAGFDSWSSELYGSAILVKLGCKVLPRLRDQNIHCYAEKDLNQLLNDTQIILEHLALIALETQINQESIEFRIGNIRAATEWAKRGCGGGVAIGKPPLNLP
jgi:hypothetical protein